MRILGIVERDLTEVLEQAARVHHLDSEVTDDPETGFELATLYAHQAIVLSDRLITHRLCDYVARLRKAKLRSSIVVLGSPDVSRRVSTLVEVLASGADDYVLRPFHTLELMARLAATSRRYQDNYRNEFTLGPATVDMYRRQLRVGEKVVRLTGREYAVCEALALSRGRTITKQQIMEQVYGGFSDVETKIVDVYIFKIRDKLRISGVRDRNAVIETVWGRGYRGADAPPDRKAPGSSALVSEALGA